MTKFKDILLNYWVPIIALLVICLQFYLVNSSNLNKWKGGGFGMYSEVHYYYNEVLIDNLRLPLDSIQLEDKNIQNLILELKRIPSDKNLHHLAMIAAKYASNDTITVEVWKPLVNAKKSSYSREFLKRYQYIKK